MGKSLNHLAPPGFKRNFPALFEFLRLLKNGDQWSMIGFIFQAGTGLSLLKRAALLWHFFWIGTKLESPHTHSDILKFVTAMLKTRKLPGGYVECGCFKGSSTAKFSLVAGLIGKKLTVFDSFEGIPDNSENHDVNIYGEKTGFRKGDFAGGLDEVTSNVAKFGNFSACIFKKGWFEDTLPTFSEPVSAAYIDVDLASSTETCITYLYPLLEPHGILMSQDGHLPLVLDVLKNEEFWRSRFSISPPLFHGLGKRKTIYMSKI